MKKRKISFPCQELNPISLVVKPIPWLLYHLTTLTPKKNLCKWEQNYIICCYSLLILPTLKTVLTDNYINPSHFSEYNFVLLYSIYLKLFMYCPSYVVSIRIHLFCFLFRNTYFRPHHPQLIKIQNHNNFMYIYIYIYINLRL